MKIQKARYVKDIYKALKQAPLELSDLDEFYQNTDKARGQTTRSRIARSLNNSVGGENQQILFVANGGCGKSTELVHLEKDINSHFLVFKYSVYEELDPVEINYIELIIITMEKLFAFVEEENLIINQDFINDITGFLKTEEIQQVNDQYMGLSSDLGGEINSGIPYLAKFFAKFRLSAKSSRSMKQVLTKKVEPHFSTLLHHCNVLIKEIKLQIKDLGKKDLLIIIEDLDKIKLNVAENLFLNYAQQITSLQTNVIYTYPISLFYNLKFNQIKNLFSQIYELPMIKVASKAGAEDSIGTETMTNIIKARMELALFHEPTILKEFIKLSGGVIRDLFTLISEAAESCLDDNRDTINNTDEISAINRLKNDYRNTIADNDEDNITASEYYQALIKLANSSTKKPTNEKKIMHLRQNLTVLSYNGEGWSDVHPIVKKNMIDLEIL